MNDLLTSRTELDCMLPEQARTRSGVVFDPRADRWSYRDRTDNVSLNFSKFCAVTDGFMTAAKMALLWYAESLSEAHLMNMYQRLEHFLRVTGADRDAPLDEITNKDVLNYRATLSKRTSWYLGSLSGFLQKWHELGYPGVSDDAVACLKLIRTPGNLKGEAVLTMDPEMGPFTTIEIESIHKALDHALTKGEITREYYLLAYLYMLLGQRSVQYAGLKVCDVDVISRRDGVLEYLLRVPRAKQRTRFSRTEFKHRLLIPKIGEMLVEHANQVREEFAGKLMDPSQAPLFPAKQSRANEPAGFEYHRTAQSLAGSLEMAMGRLDIRSERTGKPLHITATRFRRTVGTRAAEEGHGELVIAELLDHSDTQNVGVYTEATPKILERIDRAMAMYLAPLAQAFSGMLIEDESLAIRGDDPSSRICDPRFDSSMRPIGNCGKHGFCGALAPISCYTCNNFQPWLDGPHEAVFAHLLEERERLLSFTDERMASINDRTVLAVAEVVRLCEAANRERSAVAHG